MFFRQYFVQSLNHSSYLIADKDSGLAAIVDPQRDVEDYLYDLDRHHFTLQYIFLTHFHHDFVTGHLELQHATSAAICLGSRAYASYPFRALAHKTELECGAIRFTVLETPGHTPESIVILAKDLRNPAPTSTVALTGDTLLVNDIGRPDIMTGDGHSPRELAEQLYESLHTHLLTLPDNVRVYPAHGNGASTHIHERHASSSTIGDERLYNHALRRTAKASFVDWLVGDTAPPPESHGHYTVLNRRNHRLLGDWLLSAMKPLTLTHMLELKRAGAQLLDVRPPDVFAQSHVSGSINIALDGDFETWACRLLDREHPIVLTTELQDERRALTRLACVGIENIAGYLHRGVHALLGAPESARRIRRVPAELLYRELYTATPPLIVDVRSEHERSRMHIEHSRHLPLSQLLHKLDTLPKHRTLVMYCSNGYRSSIAASLLQRHGFHSVEYLSDGFDAWAELMKILSADADHQPAWDEEPDTNTTNASSPLKPSRR